jgi:hypothetical protein
MHFYTGAAGAIPVALTAALAYPIGSKPPQKSPGRIEAAEVLRPAAWTSIAPATVALGALGIAGINVADHDGYYGNTAWKAKNLRIAHWTWGALGIGVATAGVTAGAAAILHSAQKH